jgi:hypothetical protein
MVTGLGHDVPADTAGGRHYHDSIPRLLDAIVIDGTLVKLKFEAHNLGRFLESVRSLLKSQQQT